VVFRKNSERTIWRFETARSSLILSKHPVGAEASREVLVTIATTLGRAKDESCCEPKLIFKIQNTKVLNVLPLNPYLEQFIKQFKKKPTQNKKSQFLFENYFHVILV